MKVRVRLFAALREVVGQDQLEMEMPAGSTVSAVWEKLLSEHPRLSPYGKSIQFAVNHDFVARETDIAADDEVAFLPPVSGG